MKKKFVHFARQKRFNIWFSFITTGLNIKIRGALGWAKHFLPYLAPYDAIKESNKNVVSLLLPTRKYLHSFWTTFDQLVAGITRGYFIKLVLHGIIFKCYLPKRRYRNKHKKRYLFARLGIRHFICAGFPTNSHLWAKKRDITVVNVDNIALKNFVINFRRLYWPNAYKGTGVQYRGETVATKPGKKR